MPTERIRVRTTATLTLDCDFGVFEVRDPMGVVLDIEEMGQDLGGKEEIAKVREIFKTRGGVAKLIGGEEYQLSDTEALQIVAGLIEWTALQGKTSAPTPTT